MLSQRALPHSPPPSLTRRVVIGPRGPPLEANMWSARQNSHGSTPHAGCRKKSTANVCKFSAPHASGGHGGPNPIADSDPPHSTVQPLVLVVAARPTRGADVGGPMPPPQPACRPPRPKPQPPPPRRPQRQRARAWHPCPFLPRGQRLPCLPSSPPPRATCPWRPGDRACPAASSASAACRGSAPKPLRCVRRRPLRSAPLRRSALPPRAARGPRGA
mmetsp:Transcript_103399/g.267436  ORF Transcript_103399/g.267436 Transcript_103399/m.267436 type:complete len:217 (+) Transcript_103399:42-692(+)